MGNLVIYGAGGHGKVVFDAAQKAGWQILGFVDDNFEVGGEVCSSSVIANTLEGLEKKYHSGTKLSIVVAIGDNKIRMEKTIQVLQLGVPVATIIHPNAVIGKYSCVQTGAVVLAGAVVNTSSVVGVGAIINTGAVIDHDNIIGNYVHVSPGAVLGGNVVVKTGAHISIGCSIRDKVFIGKWSVVGVGSVVVKDVPNNVMVFGCPAKVYKEL
ncbi:MAG: NeuD/PglB/VioB family sugar acetyltransferase [Candidatus Peribacteraceae bacterium]|nr:NeuD/PglB/VioB family sugar acetyltransferase [Candidatus Peribacteraceae bacterium]